MDKYGKIPTMDKDHLSFSTAILATAPRLEPAYFRCTLRREVTLSRYFPDKKNTYCNFFVRTVLHWFGWRDFEDTSRDQAGEMTLFMKSHPENFALLTNYTECKVLAMAGFLVIAGQSNPKPPPTGHVCVIAPENDMHISGKWNKLVPMVANVGRTNFYGKGLSYGFKTEPELFWYIGGPNSCAPILPAGETIPPIQFEPATRGS